MNAYAIAHIQSIQMGPQIVRYLERIDGTLKPFGGRFLVHGAQADVREGPFKGDVIVIGFPDRESATGWYESAAYRQIVALRTDNSEGWVIFLDGVPSDHRVTDILSPEVVAPER